MKPFEEVFIFLGPSLPRAEAEGILHGNYLPPIRRGDLEALQPGAVAVIIDGVFEQHLSVSPAEILEAASRGIRLFGGGSMGALRAAEVPLITGVGKIFEWYRDGIMVRDDEVALLFDPETSAPLTIPAVNIRFAAGRLCSLGTIDQHTADLIVTTALSLPFKKRTYPNIFRRAGLAGRADSQDLIAMLKAYDLKAQDARTVLETVAEFRCSNKTFTDAPSSAGQAKINEYPSSTNRIGDASEMFIWETGDKATLHNLLDFLIFTGKVTELVPSPRALLFSPDASAQSIFDNSAKNWGWISADEASVTLSDLGISLETLSGELLSLIQDSEALRSLVKERSGRFMQQVLSRLFVNELSLKREVMRFGSLTFFSRRYAGPASQDALYEAKRVLCKLHQVLSFADVTAMWESFGVVDTTKQDAFVEQLAKAREAVRSISISNRSTHAADISATEKSWVSTFLFTAPKPDSRARHTLPLAESHYEALRLSKIIGVSRIGMIGELSGLSGAFVAQAARPGNAWSSSYGSGKSLSREGAVIGSIMEELEKWAQEKFLPSKELKGSYRELQEKMALVDPGTLDLPHDTVYSPDLEMTWHAAVNILDNAVISVPVDVLTIKQGVRDIMFTRRGGRKILATNGLGAGFSREEAVLHALCEYVERHAQRMAELRMTNPGGIGSHLFQFVCLEACGKAVAELARQIASEDTVIRVLDITSEIAIPTFQCVIMRNFKRAEGFGTHPNAEIAIEMAMLEAYQTISSYVAGGREDLSVRARSLGRHERPRPISAADGWFWLDPDAIFREPDEQKSFVSGDILSDIQWSLAKIRDAGSTQVLAIDLTPPDIAPAHVIKIIIPGLETNSPFYLGPRGRALLLSDIVPASQVLECQ